MKTVILAGGLGTRLSEETEAKPKPMVEIGGMPILWHIMKIFGEHGYSEFIVALGYKGEVIKNFFLEYYHMRNNLTINLPDGKVNVHDGDSEGWTVHLVDTGLHTQTGGRLQRLFPWTDNETFMMTYGDGVADVDIPKLVDFHRGHKRVATVTAVRPPARFGALDLSGNIVTKFAEKPQTKAGWINGGFFVLEPEVADYIKGDEKFESGPLQRLAEDGQLAAYFHDGFWQPMDTLRDVRSLNGLWESSKAPWKIWK